MKTTNSVKNRLAKFAELTAALVLAAHFFVPAINILANDGVTEQATSTKYVDFSSTVAEGARGVSVFLNKKELNQAESNEINYFTSDENKIPVSVTAPYETIITKFTVTNGFDESKDLLAAENTFPVTASDINKRWNNEGYYTVTNYINGYNIAAAPLDSNKKAIIKIEVAPSDFTTSSLTKTSENASIKFLSAAYDEADPYDVIDNDTVTVETLPTSTKIQFTAKADEGYEDLTVEFNGEEISPIKETSEDVPSEDGVPEDNPADDATPEDNAPEDASSEESTSEDNTPKDPASEEPTYSITLTEGKNTLEVSAYKPSKEIISAEENDDKNIKGNNSAAADSVKALLEKSLSSLREEVIETINDLKAAIKKASAITVAVNSKKVKVSEISDAYAREFLKLTAAAEDEYEIAGYYNVDLKLTIKKGDDTTTHNIKNLGTTRTIKLNVSDLDFPAVPTNFSRKYYIILGHTYKDATTSRIIDADLENNVLSFGTNIFSTVYAVAYVDTPDEGLIKTIDYSNLGGAKIKFVSATYDGTTYTDPAKCNLFTWGETSATLPRGTELKFSLEASEDYQLSSLKIGDTDVDPNSASHTLTVGDENVAISATTERESATVKFIAKDGKIDFQGATYTNAAGEEETYGSDYSDPAYSAPFGYDANNNALTLPRGATVKVKVTANSRYYLKDLTYSVGDNKETLKADEDGVYTFVLSDHQADLTADFGETMVSYATSIEKKSDTDNDTLAYLYKNGLGHANTYRIEYIKTTTEGGKVVSTESLDTYDTPVSITLDAGAFDKVLKPSYTRTVSIVYKDASGKVHELDKDLNKIAYDEAEGKVSFETTSFGLFTIVCVDSYDESLVANLDFEDVIKQGAKVSLKKAIYNGTPINFETSSDAFSWSSTKAHFPVNTTVYFTVEAEKDYDLVSVSLDGDTPKIDEETGYYVFTAAETGRYTLSATTLRKSAKLLFDYNHEHGKVTIDNTVLLSGATATFTITPNQGYKVKSVLATSLGDTSAPVELTSENTYSIILAPGDNTITIEFEAATEEEQPSDQPGVDNPGQDQPGTDNPGDDKPSDQPGTGDQPGDDKPSDQPGNTPGTDQPSNPGSGTGTGTGAGDVAPIGGGSQITTSGSNSEYFLPEDEFGVVKVTNPLKNLAGKINKLTVGKKKLTVKLTKVKNAAGYQIVYRVKGTKTWKTTTTTSLTKTIKSLKKGKKYQVKVRAYKKVQGQTFYSKWSATKTTAKIK